MSRSIKIHPKAETSAVLACMEGLLQQDALLGRELKQHSRSSRDRPTASRTIQRASNTCKLQDLPKAYKKPQGKKQSASATVARAGRCRSLGV